MRLLPGILDRYIARAVIAGSLVVLIVFVSLELVFSFVEESGDISDDYSALQALVYVALSAPQRAYEAFPVATLIGSLMTLGGMAARSELVVMRAAGVSVLGVGRAVALAGLVLALLAALLGELVAPPAERMASDIRAQARGGDVAMLSDEGFWVRDGRRFVQVGRAASATQLQNLRIYEFDAEHRLSTVTSAAHARYREAGEWALRDVRIEFFSERQVLSEREREAVWSGGLTPDILDVVVVDPTTLAVRDLLTYIAYLDANELESEQYRLAFWLKLVTPIATLTMLLLTIPLVFGSLRSVGAGQRIFVGIMLGIAFYLANRLLNHMGLVYGLPPSLSALLPTLLFLAVALVATARVR